jgi:hypothetical protein
MTAKSTKSHPVKAFEESIVNVFVNMSDSEYETKTANECGRSEAAYAVKHINDCINICT